MAPMNRRILLSSIVGGVLVVGAAAGGFVLLQQHEAARDDRAANTAATSFARAWTARKLDDPIATYAGSSPKQVAASFRTTTGALGAVPVKVTVSDVSRDGETGTARLHVAWQVGTGRTWAYDESVGLKKTGQTWGVVANGKTSLWHPKVPAGTALSFEHTWGKRGDILDRNGQPLLTTGTVYDIGLDPSRATPQAAAEVEKLTHEAPGSLVTALAKAKASKTSQVIDVITYRESDFAPIKARLDALPGVVHPTRDQPLAESRTFAQPLLGSYGMVGADRIQASNGRFAVGDRAGLTGVQGSYDSVLGGTPGISIRVGGATGEKLYDVPAKDGTSVTMTLDPKVQRAAEAALTGSKAVPSALVAVNVKTGELVAVANSAGSSFNSALRGQYAPGSTLKVATTYALLTHGLTPSTPVNCPPKVTVEGTTMQNYEGEKFGTVPFSTDFAKSCNTAFIGLGVSRLGNNDLHQAATALGIGAGWDKTLGVPAFDGSIPPASGATERATTAFGQGKTLVSPAALAVMSGSVARGSYLPPVLVKSPAPQGADHTPKALDAKAVSQLQQLMRLVVTSGTGTKIKTAPGGPVYGKTGTAEFGTSKPFKTRAWFTGWQGDLAFAVLVEEGKSGGDVAAPLGRAFLAGLH